MLTLKGRHAVLLYAVLLLGFALRLSQPTWVEFKRDEATIARLGQAIAYEGYRPATGVDSSLGIDNLPLTLYLTALPLRFWGDPLAAVLFIAFLNALALPLCYRFARACVRRRRGLERHAALLATLLFAVSPWAVLYSRKIWARTLPIFTLAFIGAAYLTFVRGRRWMLVPTFVSLAALVGLQLEALAFVPLLGLFILLYRDNVAWRPFIVGALVAFLLLGPYILHDAHNGWENMRGLVAYAGGGSTFSWDALRYAFMLLGSAGIEGQAGPFHRSFLRDVPSFWWFNDLLSVLMVLALGYGAYQAFRGATRERRRTFGLLLLWWSVPVVLQLRPSAPTQLHYFVMHYPVQYILIAASLVSGYGYLARRLQNAARGALWRLLLAASLSVLLLSSGWQVAVTHVLRIYMQARPTTGGYGIPLHYRRLAAQRAAALSDGEEVVVLSAETQIFLTETPTVFDALLFDVPHRFADGRAAVPLPETGRAVYLADLSMEEGADSVSPAVRRLVDLSSVQLASKLALPDEGAYRIYAWATEDRAEALTTMTPLAAGIPFANKVVFAAYEVVSDAESDGVSEIWLAWWLQGPPPEGAHYHFTVQMLDDQGRLVAQDDHAAFPSIYWAPGDLVLSRFAIPASQAASPGSYVLRAGMYTYPDIEIVPVVNAQGEPVDDGVTLTTVTVTD
ncbi:MAG: hypothetical protein ACP5HG_03185 [Anaerolineae bacterium]